MGLIKIMKVGKKHNYQAEKSIFYKNMPNSNPKTARESIIMRI